MIDFTMGIKCSLMGLFLILINISDIKSYKIKNKVIVPTILVGLIIALINKSLPDSLYGMLIPLVLFPFYALKMLGAGDVKAMCAIGTFLGFRMSVINMALTFVSGGIIAIIFMLCNGNFFLRMKYLFNYFKMCLFSHKVNSYEYGGGEKSYFRFSFAITAGTILTIVNQYLCII